MRIYRYELNITDHQSVTLPLGYKLLSVAPSRQYPQGLIDMWAQVPEVAPEVNADIRIIGTGNPMPADLHRNGQFIGTVVAGALVWHVFEAVTA